MIRRGTETLLALLAVCDSIPSPVDAREAAVPELERVTAELRAVVQDLRGERFTGPVKVALAGAEELLEHKRRRLAAVTTPAELRAKEEAAKLLGLLPPDFDVAAASLELSRSLAGGFYDAERQALFLMEGFEGGLARFVLVHELVHALDDQLFGLDELRAGARGNLDAQWAASALTEGSATTVAQLWLAANRSAVGFDPLAELTGAGLEQLGVPAFLSKPRVGAYVLGHAFLAQRPADLELSAAVRRAFHDPPRTSEQVLHPGKYWGAERDVPVPVRFDRDRLPDGWRVLGEDTLGELVLALLVEPSTAGTSFTSAAATGWDGDRWLLVGRGDDRVLVLAGAWDTETDAREFAAAVALRTQMLTCTAQELSVTQVESHVEVVMSRGDAKSVAEAARGWSRFE